MAPRPPEPDEGETLQERIDRALRPMLQESLLWPVTFSVGAVIATFVATILVWVVRERNLFASAALLGLVWLSVDPLLAAWRRRRLGTTAGLVILLWVLAIAIALAGVSTGFL